jgi:glycosyltransferase involved in cell wall biosynthesis
VNVLFYNPNRTQGFGGIEHWMLDVAAGLIDRGHGAVVYGRRSAGWLREAAARNLPRVAGFFGVDFHPLALGWLCAAMRRHAVDVVFAKGKKGARLAAAAARLIGRGRVVLVLGIEGELRDRTIDRWTWRYAVDRGMVLAEEARAWYERMPWVADGRLRVLFKGVDTTVLDPARVDGLASRRALGLPPEALVVGTVGRLVWQKGHVHLLEAAARLGDSLPGVRYLIVGAGEEERRLRAQAQQNGLADRVVFAGYRHDVPAIMAAMDVFVLPSRRENMPQALLEAMAMGRAIISTASIGVREVVEDGVTGFVVPLGDVDALAERMRELGRDAGLRARMGAGARARIRDGFTREDMLTRVEGLLGEMVADSSRAPARPAAARRTCFGPGRERRRGGRTCGREDCR